MVSLIGHQVFFPTNVFNITIHHLQEELRKYANDLHSQDTLDIQCGTKDS